MRWPVALFIGWIVLGLDTALRPALAIGGTSVAPTLAIPFVVFIALNAPTIPTLWTAVLLGLMLDLTSPRGPADMVVIGPHVLGFIAAAYLVTTLRGVMMRKSLIALVLLSILATALAHLVAVAVLTLRSMYPGTFEVAPLRQLLEGLGSAVVSGIAALCLGLILIPLHGVFRFQEAHGRRFNR